MRHILWGFLLGAVIWLILALACDNEIDIKKQERQIIMNHFSS